MPTLPTNFVPADPRTVLSSDGAVDINAGSSATIYTVAAGKTFQLDEVLIGTDSATAFLVKLQVNSGTILERHISLSAPLGESLSDVLKAGDTLKIVWPAVTGKFGTFKLTGFERDTGLDQPSQFFASGVNKVAKPTFSPRAGTYHAASALNVTAMCSEGAAHLFVTTDGTDPTHTADAATGSTVRYASNTAHLIAASDDETQFRVVAYISGRADSDVATAIYDVSSRSGGGVPL